MPSDNANAGSDSGGLIFNSMLSDDDGVGLTVLNLLCFSIVGLAMWGAVYLAVVHLPFAAVVGISSFVAVAVGGDARTPSI